MSPSRRHRPHDGAPPQRSIFQYLDILRDRWLSATIAFAIVAGFIMVNALFATPSYESHAVIQLDMTDSNNDPLAEIALYNPQANVDAELEVMRSHSVAGRAALSMGAGAIIREENAYRPWDSFVRSRTGGGSPTRMKARIVGRKMPLRGGTFRLTFDASGERFDLEVAASEERLGTHAFQGDSGADLDVVGEKVHVDALEGPLANRVFILQLKTEPEAAKWVQAMARATQVGYYTGIIELGAAADDPYLARDVATALAESYLEHKQERKSSQIKRRIEWLRVEMKSEKEDLTQALDARDQYITEHGAILLSEKATAAFEAQSRLFEQRLQQQQIQMQEEAALEALRNTSTPERVMAAIGATNVDPQTKAIADSLVQLEVQRGSLLRQRSTTEDPIVKRLDAEITEAREMLEKRIEALRGEVEAQIKRRIGAVHNRLDQIKQEVAKHDEVLDGLPQEERALAELTRNVEAAQNSYAFLERMKGEAELALSSTLTEAHEVDPALLDETRKSPVLFRRALVACLLGFLAAFGVALLRHLRDRTVQSPRDLEEGLGLQLYAAIPQFNTVPRRQRRGLESSLVVRDVPTSTLTENYRTLRANIRFADSGEPIQAIAITSALPKEGKTITTLNLATAMARAGNSVIVVDADLRRPTVDEHLGGERKPGIVEVLLGETPWRDAVQSSNVDGLSFIAAGRKLNDPSPLLEAGHFEEMLQELREEFEYILFDVPPVLAVADAAAFFRALDAVFLVCRQGACPVDILAGAREQVERFGGNLLGAIFNGFDAKRAGSRRYGYGGYYGYHAYQGYYAEHSGTGGGSRGRADGAPVSEDAEATKQS